MRCHGSERFSTLPEMLQYLLNTSHNSFAFNHREAGYWRHLSSEEFGAAVRRFALGLNQLGLQPGDAVGILAQPSPWWLIADLATMCAGGISVPLFPTLSPEHLAWEIANAKLRFLVVVGDAQWRMAAPHLKQLHKIITRSVGERPRQTIDFQGVMELGDAVSERDPRLFARLRGAVKPDDAATIIHTSGSTGKPKGVVLTHANLVSQVHGAAELFPLDPGHDRALTCLPLAHVFERMVMYYYLSAGIAVYFCDDIKNVGQQMREVKPTVMTMVPRLIEKLHLRIVQDIDGGGAVKKQIGHWALDKASGHQPADKRGWPMDVADSLVYKKIRGGLGGNLRYCIVGGAALASDLARFLTNVGVPVYVGYGLTEASPVISVNCPAASRIGTVGKPWPGVEVRIGEHDEILARGPGVMRGYLGDEEATRAVIDADGWLHTGDCGRFDEDGFLVITGRIKELLKTSNGKYVCPVPIEQALTASGLVDMAMVVAEGRRYVSALLFPNAETLKRRKEAAGCTSLTDEQYLAGDAVRQEVDALVATVNHGLDHWEQVRSWRMVLTPPSIEREELTPTMKIRRHVISARYAELIESMYADTREGATP